MPRVKYIEQQTKHKQKHILMTLLGIELRLLLLPRRLALIELVPFDDVPSRSRSIAFCVDASNDANKFSAKSGKCRRNSQ